MRNSKCSSHLPVLKLLYSIKPFKNVLEFGCGNYSTKYFLEVCDHVTSIENMSLEWFNKINSEITSSKLNISYKYADESSKWMKNNKQTYDLIFVDGIELNGERENCVNASFNKSPIIAIHDRGLRSIKKGWLTKINKPDNYALIIVDLDYPTTPLFVSDVNLIQQLKTNEKYLKGNW